MDVYVSGAPKVLVNSSSEKPFWAAKIERILAGGWFFCASLAAAAALLLWRNPSAIGLFQGPVSLASQILPIDEWASTSPMPEMRRVYYLLTAPCFVFSAAYLTVHYGFPLYPSLVPRYRFGKRLFAPFGSAFLLLIVYAVESSPFGDNRLLSLGTSNMQLILFGWFYQTVCGALCWLAGVGLWKSLTGK